MSKLSADVIKSAARQLEDLRESALPEVKLLLDNPQFALGLCLVLHKEVVELKKKLEALIPEPEGHDEPQASPRPIEPDPQAANRNQHEESEQSQPSEPSQTAPSQPAAENRQTTPQRATATSSNGTRPSVDPGLNQPPTPSQPTPASKKQAIAQNAPSHPKDTDEPSLFTETSA